LARLPLQNVDRHCAAFASATKFLEGQIMQIDTVGLPVAPEELGFFRLRTVAPILAILLIAAAMTAAITAFVGAQLATVA
jgi:ABC-type transporter Mla maintaining outer membrane lipid asymmetry permease subunit MlaE